MNCSKLLLFIVSFTLAACGNNHSSSESTGGQGPQGKGKPKDLPINEGDIFLLPPKVPHSPQRPAGTVGLVIERKRLAQELDGFLWLCSSCGEKLYEEFLHVTHLVTQLPVVFDHFYSNEKNSTCRKCGTKHAKN